MPTDYLLVGPCSPVVVWGHTTRHVPATVSVEVLRSSSSLVVRKMLRCPVETESVRASSLVRAETEACYVTVLRKPLLLTV